MIYWRANKKPLRGGVLTECRFIQRVVGGRGYVIFNKFHIRIINIERAGTQVTTGMRTITISVIVHSEV